MSKSFFHNLITSLGFLYTSIFHYLPTEFISVLVLVIVCFTPGREYFRYGETLTSPVNCCKRLILVTFEEISVKQRTFLTRSPLLTWHMSHSLPWNPTSHWHFPHMHCPWSEQIVYNTQEETRLSLILRIADTCKLIRKNPNNSFR